MGIGIAYDGGLSQLDYIIIGTVIVVVIVSAYLIYKFIKKGK